MVLLLRKFLHILSVNQENRRKEIQNYIDKGSMANLWLRFSRKYLMSFVLKRDTIEEEIEHIIRGRYFSRTEEFRKSFSIFVYAHKRDEIISSIFIPHPSFSSRAFDVWFSCIMYTSIRICVNLRKMFAFTCAQT